MWGISPEFVKEADQFARYRRLPLNPIANKTHGPARKEPKAAGDGSYVPLAPPFAGGIQVGSSIAGFLHDLMIT